MANTAFSGLPVSIGLNGSELIPISRPNGGGGYTSMATTVSAVMTLFSLTSPTRVQRWSLFSVLANEGSMATLYQAVSGDPSNQIRIDFDSEYLVDITSPLALFIQSVLGLNDSQMAALWYAAYLWTESTTSNFLLTEDGGYLLQEDGSKIILGTGAPVYYLLQEDGSYILLEDGSKLLI